VKNEPTNKTDPTGKAASTYPYIPWPAPEIVITGTNDVEKLLLLNQPRGEGDSRQFDRKKKEEKKDDCEGNGLGPYCAAGPAGVAVCSAEIIVLGLCFLLKGDTADRDRDADCAEEWDHAREVCREELAKPPHQQDKHKTGGSKTVEHCAAGLVSKRCGGNPI
jgi:hypothetical protein